jgi:hypothetical protein
MCSFCGRPRTLRREEHVLGALVRTIVTCESCHRTLSSSVGVAATEPAAVEEPAPVASPAPDPEPLKAAPKRAPAKRATTAAARPKATARRTTAPKK